MRGRNLFLIVLEAGKTKVKGPHLVRALLLVGSVCLGHHMVPDRA
jgi:hypothetical protein